MWCMFPKVGYQYQLKRCWILVDIEESDLTSWSYQPSGISVYLQRSFSEKLLTPKGGGSSSWRFQPTEITMWIQEALLARVLIVLYNETGLIMFNVRLRYKPTSSWSILFHSGLLPRQLSCLKNSRDMVVPGGGFRKEIIIQGVQIEFRLSCVRQLFLKIKTYCNGSIFPCTQTKE